MNPVAGKVLRAALVLALLLLLTSLCTAADSQTTVDTVGSSTIYSDNVPRARELAISDGLSAALEQVAASQLPIESLIQNFKTLDQVLFSRSDAFIEDFKVLTEVRGTDTYRVLVRATISLSLLRQELAAAGIMVGERPMPRVVLFLTEQKIGEAPPSACPVENAGGEMPSAAAAMARRLKANGFTVIDPEALGRRIDETALDCRPDYDNIQAARIAAKIQADIVIVGKSEAAYAANTMGGQIRSFSGEVSVRAIRTDTAETVASATETAVVTGTDPAAGSRAALSDAGSRAAAALVPVVIADWKTEKTAEPIAMSVVGTQNLGHFVMFRRALTSIEGVTELQTREIGADEAALVVEYDGNAQELADALLRIPFEAFGIDITQEGPRALRVALISR